MARFNLESPNRLAKGCQFEDLVGWALQEAGSVNYENFDQRCYGGRLRLSGPKFAALCGVKYQTFAGWLARRKSQRQAPPKRQPQRKAATQVRWLEASVQRAAASTNGLLLELPGGVRAHLSNKDHLPLAVALVRALEKPC